MLACALDGGAGSVYGPVVKPPIDFYFDFSVAVLVHRVRMGRGAGRAPWAHGALARHLAGRDVPGRRSCAARWRIRSSATTACATFAARRVSRACPMCSRRSFRCPTLNLLRVFWWLEQSHGGAQAAAWARAGLRAYFTRGVMVSQAAALRALASECGIDAQQAEAACDRPGRGRRGSSAPTTRPSPPACSAYRSSWSTASPSGAMTARRRSSAGWRRGRSEFFWSQR